MRLLSRVLSWGTALLCAMASVVAAASQYNMTPGVTRISHEIHALHMAIFWVCCGIGFVVFGVLIYSLIHFRKSKGAVAADFHEHMGVEITWAVIPFIILVVMAIPATRVLIDMSDTKAADLSIKITGYQWKWQYEYLDQGVSFFSNLATPLAQINNKVAKEPWYLLEVDKPLVVPVHQKIRFLVTSKDVIHSWWVPDLAIKRDAIPGFIHEAWTRIDKPGFYRGQCAELCGVNHGFMPIVVKAVSEKEFATWLAQQRGTDIKSVAAGSAATPSAAPPAVSQDMSKEELMQKGEEAYNTSCAVCHKPDGSGMPPAFPALKASPIALGAVEPHLSMVVYGKQGTAMQAFGEQLDDATLAAIITYERVAWGNEAANKQYPVVVQPSAVAAVRAKK